MIQACLIRHGETEWNRKELIQGCTDIPLNGKGRKQARMLGRHLAGERWDIIYSSPLSRAYETAGIIAEYMGIREIITDSRLKERCFGKAEGMEVRHFREKFSHNPVPEAEDWGAVKLRVADVMDDIAERHPETRILVITHGGVIASLIRLFAETSPEGRLHMKNLSMNLLTYEDGWRIVWYNRVIEEIDRLDSDNQ